MLYWLDSKKFFLAKSNFDSCKMCRNVKFKRVTYSFWMLNVIILQNFKYFILLCPKLTQKILTDNGGGG